MVFKVGDKVRYVAHGSDVDEEYYRIGDEYTITSFKRERPNTYYVKEVDGVYIFRDQLELVEDPEPVVAHEEPGFLYHKTEPKKYNAGKPRTDLISGEFTLALGEALAYGADKYDEVKGETPNYLKGDGFLYSDLLGALERHLAKFKSGINVDEESELEHIVQVAVNAMFLYNYRISGKGKDDRIELTKSE